MFLAQQCEKRLNHIFTYTLPHAAHVTAYDIRICIERYYSACVAPL